MIDKTQLKATLHELYSDFYESELPALTRRECELPQLPNSATVVVGMRRTGKTYLLYQKMGDLLSAGLARSRMLYLNFEDDRLMGMTVDDLRLVTDVYYSMYPNNRSELCYFFFDEIQNIEHWEMFIRRLVDTPNTAVFLSGSSAKLLSKELATAMRGRSVEVENFPLSFSEFLLYHKYFEQIPQNISSATRSKLQNAVERYFTIGGMPAVQKIEEQVRASILQGYVNSVVYRDVAERYSIPNSQALKFIMQMLFNNPARPLSVRKIADFLSSQQITISREYTADYLDYLVDSYLVHRVSLYSESASKRRLNPDKYYLNDVGIIRSMRIKHALDLGPLLENLVYLHLRHQGYKLEYVLTSDKSEVDFFASKPMQGDYKLIQVCYDMSNQNTFQREVTALHDASESLGIKERYVITWDDDSTLENGIRVLPIWKFLLNRFE